MSSGSREQIGHSGSRRTFSSVVVAASASYISRRPMSGSPAPMMSLTTSVAWSRPIVPGSTPRTPFAPQDGASSAGGGGGERERGDGAAVGGEEVGWAPEAGGAPRTPGGWRAARGAG